MARPQIENGYARIANELLMALSRYNLSPYETRVLFFILRKTYGWNKKSDFISVSQIAEGTGLLKPHACRAKNVLIRKNILTENDGKLGPNKDYDEWSVTNTGNVTNRGNESAIITEKQRSVTGTGNGLGVTDSGNGVTGTGNKSLPAEALQKKRKKLLQKTRRKSEDFRLATLLLQEIRKRKPDFRKPNLQSWAVHIEKMIRIDHRKPERIDAVIRWCQADSGNNDGRWRGWQNNILSTRKLREKFDRIELAMQKVPSGGAAPIVRDADGLTARDRLLNEMDVLHGKRKA